ncbi:GntR family transcriptional regulator [Nitratireductor pacificus]|uniref:Transcriptional regulator (Activator) protein n=1 Tax=Nitratireductor pacificus pht-3B TaxID=391937 RepID=K2MM64_9HYPH|nr:GntR family transcriptional regulator [Nitratireductor pacificus]EKF18322.1 transcriptional regulator (activator) protein [Nitratireductor pacificus pht-3B]
MNVASAKPARSRSHIEPEDFARRLLRLFHQDGLAPGDKLSERKLAVQLSVSRTPIRAALQHLLDDGVVARNENQKWILATLPDPDPGQPTIPNDEAGGLGMRICEDRRTGVLADSFTETELLKRYDVTRTELGRALVALASDGIVERSSGYGWHFASLLDSEERRLQSYEFRIALEPAGMRMPGFRPEPLRLGHQRSLHEALVAGGYKTANPHDLFEINADFHAMLADFSGNEFIIQAMRQQNKLRRISEYATTSDPRRVLQSCREHLMIIEAVEEGDYQWASSLMERHLQTVRRVIQRNLARPG